MFNLDNIDLKQEHSSLKEEVKNLKSYVWQLVEELKFRFEDAEDADSVEYIDSATASEVYATKDELDEKIAKNTVNVKFINNDSGASAATGAYKDICSLSLEPGTWILKGNVVFAGNVTGTRAVDIASSIGWNSANATLVSAASDKAQETCIDAIEIVQPTATTTYYLNAWQNSGSALTVKGHFKAIRIK